MFKDDKPKKGNQSGKKVNSKSNKANKETLEHKDKIEKGYLTIPQIKKSIERCKSNISKVIKELNISSETMYNYFKKYPELDEFRKEVQERKLRELGDIAIDSLIDVATSENVGGAMGNVNLASAKVKASETLAKISGLLVDKQEIEHSGNKDKPLVSVNYIIPKLKDVETLDND